MDLQKTILEYASGKKVLEVGGLGNFEEYESQDFLHWASKELQQEASQFLGIDIDEKGVERAQVLGLPYQKGNIEDRSSFQSEGGFEVIIMRDVIEHLSNVGKALDTIHGLLQTEGKLVITTPNPWALNNLFRIFSFRKPRVNSDHTCFLIEEHFQQLFFRHGFHLEHCSLLTLPDYRFPIRSRLVSLVGTCFPLLHGHFFVIGRKQ